MVSDFLDTETESVLNTGLTGAKLVLQMKWNILLFAHNVLAGYGRWVRDLRDSQTKSWSLIRLNNRENMESQEVSVSTLKIQVSDTFDNFHLSLG